MTKFSCQTEMLIVAGRCRNTVEEGGGVAKLSKCQMQTKLSGEYSNNTYSSLV